MKIVYAYVIVTASVLFFAPNIVLAQETYRTEVYRDDIKSLEVKAEGEFISNPYIELGGSQKIEINFDALHRSSGRFVYKVIHCNADWKQSSLMPIEYLKGFQNIAIEDFANSINTTTHYTNYHLEFPNEDTQLAVSGNYAVQVYDEDAPDDIIFTACFSVYEPLLSIDATIDGNTDIDFNKGHQQLNFTISENKINILYPRTDLKVVVYQNGDVRNARTNLQPLSIINKHLNYEHNRDLIFDAGNEYRRIEFLTHRYNGMGVDKIAYFNPYYHVTLLTEKKRNKQTYLYDQDQNGRFFINCSSCEDPDTEADYYIVHFSLASEKMESGDIYIYGDLFNNVFNENSRMEYNAEAGVYEKAVMLKQGLYNYQYVLVEDGKSVGSVAETEGDFYETENEYTIAVYYHPMNERYDRLVGIETVSSKHAKL